MSEKPGSQLCPESSKKDEESRVLAAGRAVTSRAQVGNLGLTGYSPN